MTAKNAKSLAEFLRPGRKVDVGFIPEVAAGLNFIQGDSATIVESSPDGLLAVLALHESKGGDRLTFIPWTSIAAICLSSDAD